MLSTSDIGDATEAIIDATGTFFGATDAVLDATGIVIIATSAITGATGGIIGLTGGVFVATGVRRDPTGTVIEATEILTNATGANVEATEREVSRLAADWTRKGRANFFHLLLPWCALRSGTVRAPSDQGGRFRACGFEVVVASTGT